MNQNDVGQKESQIDFVKVERQADGDQTTIEWTWDHPHQAGHTVALLMKSIVRTFEVTNPDCNRVQIMQELMDGIVCQLEAGGFLEGENEDLVKTHAH